MSLINRVFGDLNCALPSTKLPLCADVIKAICFEISEKKVSKKDAIDTVSKQIIELWQCAEIPMVSKQRVRAKISDQYEKYYSVFKSNPIRINHTDKVESFKVKHDLKHSILF